MRTLLVVATLVSTAVAAAQEGAPQPIRVSIAHLLDSGSPTATPRLLPHREAPPTQALGPSAPAAFDARLLDLTGYQGQLRFDLQQRMQIDVDGTDLVVDAEGVDRDALSALVLDAIEAFAPIVELEVAEYRAGPAPAPVVLLPGELDRHVAGEPVRSVRAARAAGHLVSVALETPGSGATRLRIEPHLLDASRSVALLCEFELDRRARDGSRRWTAGTASGVVPAGGALALSFPDRVLVIRASHADRPPVGFAGVSWSLLTTSALRHEPELGDGPDLLRLVPIRAGFFRSEDVLIQRLRESVRPTWWDDRISADQLPRRLLVMGANEDLAAALPDIRAAIARLDQPWVETATLDGLLCVEPDPAVPGIVRLPVMPGRVACALHGAWSTSTTPPRGALVALIWNSDQDAEAARASGFAIRLRGDELTERFGEPLRFRGFEFDRDGRAELVDAGDLRVELRRPR